MKERFAYRSGYILAFLLFAVLCTPTEQRSRCKSSSSSADCGENALGTGEEQPRGFYAKYISAVEDPIAIKQLMEQLLMQHNQLAGDNAIGTEEEENSTEKPPTKLEDESAENTTEKPPLYDRVQVLIPSTTPQPPIENALTDVLNQLKQELQSPGKDDEEPVWEITTIHPQQLSSPLDVYEHHFETTTLPPPLNPKPTEAANSTSGLVNIPPLSKKPKKPLPTKRPHIIHQPQQLDSFGMVSPVNLERIETKPVEQTSQLTPVDRVQDSAAEIQLEILNRPISTRRPPGRANLTQTSTTSRPRNKKPINIIPESPAKNKRKPKPPPPSQGSSGAGVVRKPTRKPVAVAVVAPLSESDDYLISALAALDEDEENYVDEEESLQNENEDEEDQEEEEEDEEYDYQADNSAEEERENLADASDVISSVMEEVAALL